MAVLIQLSDQRKEQVAVMLNVVLNFVLHLARDPPPKHLYRCLNRPPLRMLRSDVALGAVPPANTVPCLLPPAPHIKARFY